MARSIEEIDRRVSRLTNDADSIYEMLAEIQRSQGSALSQSRNVEHRLGRLEDEIASVRTDIAHWTLASASTDAKLDAILKALAK